jgi:hypothetical protein
MRTRIQVHIAKDHWVLEVLATNQSSSLGKLLARVHTFLIGQPTSADRVLHRMTFPVPQASSGDLKFSLQNALANVRQKLGITLAKCELDIRLGSSFSHVGHFRLSTDPKNKATTAEIDSFARAWIQQHWALDYDQMETRWQPYGTPGHYLVTCVDKAIPKAVQEVCTELGVRPGRITPASIHAFDSWAQEATKAATSDVEGSTRSDTSVLAFVERRLDGTHAGAVDFAITAGATLQALSRIWLDATAVASLMEGDGILAMPIARRLVARMGGDMPCNLHSCMWPDCSPEDLV